VQEDAVRGQPLIVRVRACYGRAQTTRESRAGGGVLSAFERLASTTALAEHFNPPHVSKDAPPRSAANVGIGTDLRCISSRVRYPGRCRFGPQGPLLDSPPMAGPLAAVERFFERLFERPAARLFQPQLETVQIQRALEREMESERRAQSRRSYVPTTFRVLLNDADAAAMNTDMRALATELAESLRLYARSRGYIMGAQPRVEIGTSSSVPARDVRAYAEPIVVPANGGNGHGHVRGQGQGALVRPPDIAPRPPAPPDLVGEPTAIYAAPQTATPRAQLAIRAPGHQILRVPVRPGTLRMGRAMDNDIVLPDDKVSRHHGQIGVRLGMLVYTDLGSTNGSYLNGSAVTEIALGPGDVLQLGSSTVTIEPVS